MDIVRIGKIHVIDYENGTASVIYNDRNKQPSPQFPFFSFAYEMPRIDDTVVVLLLPNSVSKGFILGVPWSARRKPVDGGAGIYHKEFSDGTYVRYNPDTRTMEVSAPNVILKSITADNVEVKEKLIADKVNVNTLQAVEIAAKTANIVNLNVSGTATGNFPGASSEESV